MSITSLTERRLRSMRIALSLVVDDMTREIAAAWSGVWAELVDEWSAAIDQLLDMSEDGQWPRRSQISRAKRATAALRHTAKRLDELAAKSGVIVTGSLPDVVLVADEWQEALATSQLPADFGASWSRTSLDALDAIVQRSTGQIESTLRPLPAQQQAVMKQVLMRGVAVGDNPTRAASEMLRRLDGAFDGGRRRAETIARTEILDAHREGSRQARIANPEMLRGWGWLATKSSRTCPACLAMDGTEHDLDEPGPIDHPCGRCTAVPLTRTWRDLGIDIDEPPSTYQSAREWFDEQPADLQRQIMGEERLRRLEAGELSWDQIPQVRPNADWRDSIQIAPLGSRIPAAA